MIINKTTRSGIIKKNQKPLYVLFSFFLFSFI